jgi:hypothetical protein
MPRQELHSDTMPIEQRSPISDDPSEYEGDIVLTEDVLKKEYADALAFMEDPITVRIQPSTDKNAAGAFPVWVNGKPAEVFQQNRWMEIGWLPVGRELIIKRKVLEVIIRSKVDRIETLILNQDSERPNNQVQRFTTPVHSFTIMHDPSPRGAAWASEMIRRNL